MAKKKPTAKDMADMLSNKPLPGQAIAIGPDVDPRAGQFQQAMRSMMATPDDYYRWERDQRIAEQDAKKAKADARPSEVPAEEWEKWLDKTAGWSFIPSSQADRDIGLIDTPIWNIPEEAMLENQALERQAFRARQELQALSRAAMRGSTMGNLTAEDMERHRRADEDRYMSDMENLTPEERYEWQRLARGGGRY